MSGDEQQLLDFGGLDRRVGSATEPVVTLVPRGRAGAGDAGAQASFDGLAGALVAGDERLDHEHPYAVLGGPGTGKTSLLIEAAVEFMRAGGAAEEIMFFAATKEAATDLRNRIFARLTAEGDYAATGSLVRSVHSWAFAFYRSIQLQRGKPAPRLMTGAEHDMQIREILRGTALDGNRYWPENVVPALTYVGFARQLRDLLLRAAERNVSAEQLVAYGEEYDRPMWVGAGRFLQEFNQVQRLSAAHNLNASELLHATLAALETPEGQGELERQKKRTRLLLVDDAHNLDPASGQFIQAFITQGVRTLIAGDPDQCVFHFRGADEEFLTRAAAVEDHRVVLSNSPRLSPATARAVDALRGHLPPLPTRVEVRGGSQVEDALELVESGTATAERLEVTDAVRRAHVEHGVPWEQIAVIVRGTGDIPALRRVLMSHGVPVQVDPTSIVLAEQPLVRMLLLALEASYRPLRAAEVLDLLESNVGGADPVMVRRVQRAMARAIRSARLRGRPIPAHDDGRPYQAMDLLAAYVIDQEAYGWVTEFFGPREHGVVERITAVITAGRVAQQERATTEMVLWKIWQATELSTRLQTHALRGGTLGAQADQDLDSVMNLFDLLGDFVERNPKAATATFIEEVRSQELPTGTRDRRGVMPGAVEILPAHAAAGKQWRVVIVAGVQEDSWPAGPTVGGLFGQLELVDLVDRGVTPQTPISRVAEAIQEERRLFLLAISRATEKTVVTWIRSSGDEAQVPSRFVGEIGAGVASPQKNTARNHSEKTAELHQHLPRVLAMEPLVAELRDAVTDASRPGHERHAAARNLAKLAQAGVHGADPANWWGHVPVSTQNTLIQGGRIVLSPSTLEALGQCALRYVLDRKVVTSDTTEAMRIGTLVHALAEEIVAGMSVEDAQSFVRVALPALSTEPVWKIPQLVDQWVAGIERLHAFIHHEMSRENTRVETERKLEGKVGVTANGYTVTLSGRADLLVITESQPDVAQVRVVDFKTGKSAKTKAEAEESPQLAAYQFLVALEYGPAASMGAELVFPAVSKAKGITVREQAPKHSVELDDVHEEILTLADASAGSEFTATVGNHCTWCSFKQVCPAQPEGKQVV
ncbi:MAG TPA: ATP-dependent helicase [Candidatus Corynebacterium gallistercoris]|uniref:DNA 3'-5' helicase n=1 Tax=Candidatus Corynebacterium gallistercoris TaxID=2838530 RepID=A0A9D1S0U0_9CORY|nr:ATP-dependent helicase [Candidatus Corynebacterium gallistercoris]